MGTGLSLMVEPRDGADRAIAGGRAQGWWGWGCPQVPGDDGDGLSLLAEPRADGDGAVPDGSASG